MFASPATRPESKVDAVTALKVVDDICKNLNDTDAKIHPFALTFGIRHVLLHLGWAPADLLSSIRR